MKYFYCFFLLFTVLTTKSQIRTGFQLSGNGMYDKNEMPYLVNSLHLGGEVGIVFEFPIIENRLTLTTGLNFYDNYYQLRPNEVKVWYNESYGSTISIFRNINDPGISVPLKLTFIKDCFVFDAGIKVCKNMSSSREIEKRVAGVTYGYPSWPDYLHGSSYDVINITEYKWFFEVGAGYFISPALKVKVEYALGLNDYMKHTMYVKIVNDELISPVEEYKMRLDKIGISLVYFPHWDFLKKKSTKDSSGKKAWLKEFYR